MSTTDRRVLSLPSNLYFFDSSWIIWPNYWPTTGCPRLVIDSYIYAVTSTCNYKIPKRGSYNYNYTCIYWILSDLYYTFWVLRIFWLTNPRQLREKHWDACTHNHAAQFHPLKFLTLDIVVLFLSFFPVSSPPYP